jgi:Fe-S cluster assembly ATP-binding protein
LRVVAAGINALAAKDNAMLLITHYQRILDYVTPHFVHVMSEGQIIKSGGSELAKELEAKGYEWVTEELVPTA